MRYLPQFKQSVQDHNENPRLNGTGAAVRLKKLFHQLDSGKVGNAVALRTCLGFPPNQQQDAYECWAELLRGIRADNPELGQALDDLVSNRCGSVAYGLPMYIVPNHDRVEPHLHWLSADAREERP